ncbi:MAG TPA: hypothetical protein VIV12_16755 [Streptosporangiaceae bacterium]
MPRPKAELGPEAREAALQRTAEFREIARRWMRDDAGRREMLTDIKETLIVNMLWDKEDGAGEGGRLARKQYKEYADLILSIEDHLRERRQDEPGA